VVALEGAVMRTSLPQRRSLASVFPVQATANPELRRQLIRRRGLSKIRDLRLGSALARATDKSESYVSRQISGKAPLKDHERREWAGRLIAGGHRAEAVALYRAECDGVVIPLPSLDRLQSVNEEIAEAGEASTRVVGLVLRAGRSAEELAAIAETIDDAIEELLEAKAAIVRDLDMEMAS
jgi:hypothetical protein